MQCTSAWRDVDWWVWRSADALIAFPNSTGIESNRWLQSECHPLFDPQNDTNYSPFPSLSLFPFSAALNIERCHGSSDRRGRQNSDAKAASLPLPLSPDGWRNDGDGKQR